MSKCLTYGVSMVLLPWDADQPGVAARAEALGVATTVPRDDVTPEPVSQAVNEIFDESGYQSRATNVAETLSARSPARKASEFIERL